jgi:predicted nuclease of predicted toxin-antitoxin system
LKLAADENLDQRIIDGLLLRKADLDVVTVTQAGLSSADDPAVLEWAAQEHRVLFTHDRKTMLNFAYERLAQGNSSRACSSFRSK